MRALLLSIWFGVGGAAFVHAADPYSFGPVPPPSRFSADTVITPPAGARAKSTDPTNVAPNPPTVSQKNSPPPSAPPVSRPTTKLIVTPGGGLDGKVALVDAQGRFAVLNFPLGQMPAPNMELKVYRHGVKVGELTVTGPQRDDDTVADVTAGELQVGDAVRNR